MEAENFEAFESEENVSINIEEIAKAIDTSTHNSEAQIKAIIQNLRMQKKIPISLELEKEIVERVQGVLTLSTAKKWAERGSAAKASSKSSKSDRHTRHWQDTREDKNDEIHRSFGED